MPTIAQITGASVTLTATAQAQLLALIRASERYKARPDFYVLPANAIAAASGTVKGQQLNAALALIDAVGDGTVALSGGEKGLDYSQDRDRESLTNYCMSVLYESPPPNQILTLTAENETVF